VDGLYTIPDLNFPFQVDQKAFVKFDKHKGYGTKLHREKLLTLGPTTHHRKTFLKKHTGSTGV
jgi:ribonuclease HII